MTRSRPRRRNGDGRADYLVLADNGAIHAWINNGGDAAH
jgi:predicted type IV restriction endonuclease